MERGADSRNEGVMKNYVLLTAIVAALACAKGKASGDSVDAQASGYGATKRAVTHDSSLVLKHDSSLVVPRDARRTILFVGTSLTAGYGLDADSAYPQQIQRMIDSAALPYTVVNTGLSGETSSAMLRRLDWLLRQPFDVIVIETGANDGLRGISVNAMRDNIQHAIGRIRETRPAARIVLIQMEALPNMGRAYTQQFRSAFPKLAKDNQVVLLPFLLDGVAGRAELNQADGIHPNYEGERIVARNVWKGLRPILR
jgi:acyl-CoA thioesterase-1